mmetsp:Transcript_33818/g.104719  ORF Transcript_33818/g.104719 Transcript_33818/m.104719 type:complete len:565 (-) Transcript_33818:103-1797(-)
MWRHCLALILMRLRLCAAIVRGGIGRRTMHGALPTCFASVNEDTMTSSFGAPLPPVEMAIDAGRVEVATGILEGSREAAAAASVVQLLRGSAPYVDLHRDSTMVVHLCSEVLDKEETFQGLMDDLATLHVLGVKLVILTSVRLQVNRRLHTEQGKVGKRVRGLRVTGALELAAVQVECGLARSRVEAALSRALRSGGASHGRSTIGVDVIGGNGFVSGQPVGVVDGIDTGFTGVARLVDAAKISRHLDAGEIVLLSALAYSPSGETFNVRTEEIAARAAPALLASKIIFVTEGHELAWRDANDTVTPLGRRVASLRLDDARKLLDRREELDSEDPSGITAQILDLTNWCVTALEQGVTRAHLIAPTDGALLRELYTRDGAGTLISRDIYEGIRSATGSDVDSLVSLIAPLEADGTLLERPRPKLLDEINRGCFYILARDDLPIACASLKRLDAAGTRAELGCLVVSRKYRRLSKGDALLSYLERVAIASGVQELFALSTKTMQWFVERGFDQVSLDSLPQERQDVYDKSRRPKVYRKILKADRDVDVEDAFWTRRHAEDENKRL